MNPGPIFIKFGGSLIHHEQGHVMRELGRTIAHLSERFPLVVLPGGGPFADNIRDCGERFHLSDSTCHRMALLAMDQFGNLLHDYIPRSVLIELSETTLLNPNLSAPQILLSSNYVSRLPQTVLPHSWDVTSDSIAAYLANHFAAAMLILVKSIDGSPALNKLTNFKEPIVDAYFRHVLPSGIQTWIINGHHPERLTELLEAGHTDGLRIRRKHFAKSF